MRVVLTGASGQLGAWALEELAARGHVVDGWSSAEAQHRGAHLLVPVDLLDDHAVGTRLQAFEPDAVLHLAAVSKPDAVLRDPVHARRVNVEGTARLAAWCARRGRRLVFTSTDMVFDGARGWYAEDEGPSPVVEYGRTKAEAEAVVRGVPRGLVARVPLLFGPSRIGKPTFFDASMDALRAGRSQAFFEDEYRTPLDYGSAARAWMRQG
jgi:dTDP-4-dehydrorhamnose reductase